MGVYLGFTCLNTHSHLGREDWQWLNVTSSVSTASKRSIPLPVPHSFERVLGRLSFPAQNPALTVYFISFSWMSSWSFYAVIPSVQVSDGGWKRHSILWTQPDCVWCVCVPRCRSGPLPHFLCSCFPHQPVWQQFGPLCHVPEEAEVQLHLHLSA